MQKFIDRTERQEWSFVDDVVVTASRLSPPGPQNNETGAVRHISAASVKA